MSTAAVSTSSIYQELQAYFQHRGSDLKDLGQALQSGDLAGAQKEFNAIQNLGQSGPFAGGNAFKISQRQQDFAAIGQALQSGDLAGAQQAFAQLESTFHHHQQPPISEPTPAVVVNLTGSTPTSPTPTSTTPTSTTPVSTAPPTNPTSSTPSATGPEIVLNLGKVTPGEQITIGISNASNGTEQVTIGVAGQQNQKPEQITLNLNQNSNQQIVLNLFNSATPSPAQGSAVNLSA